MLTKIKKNIIFNLFQVLSIKLYKPLDFIALNIFKYDILDFFSVKPIFFKSCFVLTLFTSVFL